ncbi:MAG: tetratricopeptide repeat protein [Opitutaceae bacterium]|jgi:Tfp pilus assembly protein PilF|nr:tetratricopeptide repeat protein [Opitutaceae bacterium]
MPSVSTENLTTGLSNADIPPPPPLLENRPWWRYEQLLLRAAIILLAGLFVAAPAFHGTWLWDDDQEITANPALTSLAGLKAIWTGHAGADFLPLKSTILWLEWHIWEYDNTCYHIANTLFHLLNALLVWRLFSLLRIRWAWVGGLLFAIHPILMESVGWVSEQKNTISLALMIPALCAYIQFDEAGDKEGGNEGNWKHHVGGLLCIIASLAGACVLFGLIDCAAVARAAGNSMDKWINYIIGGLCAAGIIALHFGAYVLFNKAGKWKYYAVSLVVITVSLLCAWLLCGPGHDGGGRWQYYGLLFPGVIALLMCVYLLRNEGGKWNYYAIGLLCFIASLLCKSAGVMLPFLLLLYDWWKHDKLRPRDLLLISAMGCALGALFLGGLAFETWARLDIVKLAAAKYPNTESPYLYYLIRETSIAKYLGVGAAFAVACPVIGFAWWGTKNTCLAKGDGWRHAWRFVLASIPFFVISVVVSVVTIHFQLKNAIGAEGIPVGGILSRTAIAGTSIWFYLGKCVWPFDLLPIYPKWEIGKLGMVDGKWTETAPPEWWQLIIPWVAFIAAFLVLWVACRSNWRRALRLGAGFVFASLAVILCFVLMSGAGFAWEQFKFWRWTISVPAVFLVLWVIAGFGLMLMESIHVPQTVPRSPSFARSLLFGLGFFLINLIPVLGFMTMSYMRITWAADHFVYISVIGIIALAVAGAAWVYDRAAPEWKPWALAAVMFALLCVGIDAHRYSGIFAGEAPMWQHTMRGNNDAWQAHSRYGKVMLDTGKFDAAFYHISQSNRLRPDLAETNNNMGVLLLQKKRVAEAIEFFRRSAETMPMPAFLLNYANALANNNRGAEAVPVYEKLIKEAPPNPVMQCNYGVALVQAGRREDAIAAFEAALKLNPNMPDAQRNLDSIRASGTAAAQGTGSISPLLGSPAALPAAPLLDMSQIPEIFRPKTSSTLQ